MFKNLLIVSVGKKINTLVLILSFSSLASADILIGKLSDIEASVTPGSVNDVTAIERFCVASSPTGPYSLLAIGTGNNGEFSIQNGAATIIFEVAVRDRQSSRSYREILSGVPLVGLQSRRLANNRICTGNAVRIRVTIASESIQRAPAGRYQGSLQLTVIPE
ncbi:MAG: hypothetical protein R8G33_03860 [Gammaproteobacteria bacterium]|nr:hypothetical protein [Gammaproteobacteria bacterium]